MNLGNQSFDNFSIEDALNYQRANNINLETFITNIANKIKFEVSITNLIFEFSTK